VRPFPLSSCFICVLDLLYLYFFFQVFKDYFGELEEESIRDNFVVVYELLDETMDFGYPQTCESKILRE
jgi:AP-1 complex subunit mu